MINLASDLLVKTPLLIGLSNLYKPLVSLSGPTTYYSTFNGRIWLNFGYPISEGKTQVGFSSPEIPAFTVPLPRSKMAEISLKS